MRWSKKARLVVTIVTLVGVFTILAAARLAYQADSLSVEAENMKGATTFFDKTASNHRAARLYQDGSLSEKFGGSVGSIAVRARGVPCHGAPRMVVSVGGRTVMSPVVRAKKWEDYRAYTTLPVGTHNVTVAFVNDYHDPPRCDRNLHVDKVTVTPGSKSDSQVRIPDGQRESGVPDVAYQPPVIFTEGGTYSGNWMSSNPGIPAIQIETTEPVVIQDSTIVSRGELIKAVGLTDVTVRDSQGYGLNPNEAGKVPGRFLSAMGFANVRLENNYIVGTAGIYLHNYAGDGTPGQTVKILRNEVRNIDGRHSNGVGGFSETDFYRVQFVQLDGVKNLPDADIGWNQVVNEPGKSRVEDNVNIYLSQGTDESPILIHDNYIQGAYPTRPTVDGYSGGGIITDGTTCNPADATAFVKIFDNQIVSTSNYGIAVYGGHDSYIYNNRIVSSGYLEDGSYVGSQNVGLYIADMVGTRSCDTWYNNDAYGNEIGWANEEPRYAHLGQRNDMWFPLDSSARVRNTSLPNPILRSTESEEFAHWQDKTAAADIVVGPRD